MQSPSNKASVPASRVEFLSRSDFPKGFVFGSSASAFQYEGAPELRGESIWDAFLIKYYPEVVIEEKGLEAVIHYERYKEDVQIMKEMGMDSYRFSISWPRVLPDGRRTIGPDGEEHGVDKLGIAFYNNLINELINNKIEPVVCLFHWDLPQALESEYKGFLDKRVVDDFCDYADLCFREFGDRVKKWVTFNETWTFSMGGYLMGTTPPGRGVTSEEARLVFQTLLPSSRATSRNTRTKVPTEGDPYREIYTVTHHQLLAHAAAVKLYREKYKKRQNGEIGIVIVSLWAVPLTNDHDDREAAHRALDFMLGWLLHPLIFGDYPESMRIRVKDRLPEFGPLAIEVKGSFDFIGLNYYTANYTADITGKKAIVYNLDSDVACFTEKDNVPIGEKVYNNLIISQDFRNISNCNNTPKVIANIAWLGASDWLYVYPRGLKELLLYIAKEYQNPPIYITENGVDELNDPKLSKWQAFYDYPRISCHYKHLVAIKEAIEQGANVKGYYAWSLLDNLEGAQAFTTRFGINYIDFAANYERFPKLSAGWFKFLLEKNVEN